MPPLRVLLVEDDPHQRRALASAIAHLGYDCDPAADGVEACAKHEARPADIVLTDWTMPRMTGLELCLKLKSIEQPRPYVVIMTAIDDRARLLEGMRAGADDFLRKPIDLDELDVRLVAASRVVHSMRALAERNRALQRDSEHSFRAARTDPLTTVANRLRLNEDLERARSHVARYRHQYCVAIADIDFFKGYNDRQGHLAGDVALQQVALAIREALRSSDMVYRYGGEEFVAVLPEQAIGEATQAMERVRAAVQELGIPHTPMSPSGVLTISIGIAAARDEPPDAWLARADAALYRAKAEGRNCVRAEPPAG